MKGSIIIFLGLTFAFLWSSCTIEKRHYQRGYHIEWRGDHGVSKPEDKLPNPEVSSEQEAMAYDETSKSEVVVETTSATEIADVTESAPDKVSQMPEKETKQKFSIPRNFVAAKPWSGQLTPPNRSEMEADNMAQLSFVYGIASWILVAIVVLGSYLEIVPFLLGLASVGSLVLAIMAIVNGNWAKKMMQQDREGKYINKRKAIIGLALGWTYIGLLLFSLIMSVLLILLLLSLF